VHQVGTNKGISASSWRSNQGYTKMHGEPNIKIHMICCWSMQVIKLFITHFSPVICQL